VGGVGRGRSDADGSPGGGAGGEAEACTVDNCRANYTRAAIGTFDGVCAGFWVGVLELSGVATGQLGRTLVPKVGFEPTRSFHPNGF
jgi:hypothetical protein